MKTHSVLILLATLVAPLTWIPQGQAANPGTANKKVLERIEASVNQSLILTSDVVRFRKTWELRKQLDPLFMESKLIQTGPKATSADIVEFLVEDRLIAGQFPTTDTMVEQEIGSIQATNKISREELKAALAQQGFEFKEYYELVRTGISKRNLVDSEIRSRVTITDDDIRNYFYNKYVRDSSSPKQFKARIISVQTENYASPTLAKSTLEEALKSIQQGESFESVAKRMSDDATASEGGFLGALSEDELSGLFRSTLQKLQLGQVSEIINEGGARFFVLKLEDVSTGDNSRLQKMKEEIRGLLAAKEYQNQLRLWIERTRQGAFIHLASKKEPQEARPTTKESNKE